MCFLTFALNWEVIAEGEVIGGCLLLLPNHHGFPPCLVLFACLTLPVPQPESAFAKGKGEDRTQINHSSREQPLSIVIYGKPDFCLTDRAVAGGKSKRPTAP